MVVRTVNEVNPAPGVSGFCPGAEVHKSGDEGNTAGCGRETDDGKDMEKEALASDFIRFSGTGHGNFLFLSVIPV